MNDNWWLKNAVPFVLMSYLYQIKCVWKAIEKWKMNVHVWVIIVAHIMHCMSKNVIMLIRLYRHAAVHITCALVIKRNLTSLHVFSSYVFHVSKKVIWLCSSFHSHISFNCRFRDNGCPFVFTIMARIYTFRILSYP